MNPDLVDLNVIPNQDLRCVAVPTSNAETLLLPNNHFWNKQLINNQHCFFIFMRYVAEWRYPKVNGKSEPEPLYIFLSSTVGVGKSS